MSLLQLLNLHPKRSQKNNGDVAYKTLLGDNRLEIFRHTKTVKHTRIWIWKTTHQISDIQALTYDYQEQRGEHVRRDLFIIGYRLKNGSEPTVFKMNGEQSSRRLISDLKNDLRKSIDRKKYL